MLKNDFYAIAAVNTNGNIIVCEIVLNESHAIYEGHFPGQPVVPGACMLQMVGEVLAVNIGKAVQLMKASDIKFLQMVDPHKTKNLTLNIQFSLAEGLINVNASMHNEGVTYFKCRAVYNTH